MLNAKHTLLGISKDTLSAEMFVVRYDNSARFYGNKKQECIGTSSGANFASHVTSAAN